MQESDREEFVTLIAALASTFRTETDEAMFEGYWLALSDLPLEAVQRAVAKATRECEFFPRGKELRELSGELTLDGRATLAWMAASKAIGHHGHRKSVDFDDRTINATIRAMGGWVNFGNVPETEFDKWTRKEFEKTYRALAVCPLGNEATAPLVGMTDRENGILGYDVQEPLLIETGVPQLRLSDSRQSTANGSRRALPHVEIKRP